MLRVENQIYPKTHIAKIGNYLFTENAFVIFYEIEYHDFRNLNSSFAVIIKKKKAN